MDLIGLINQIRELLDQLEQAVGGSEQTGGEQMPPELIAELAAGPAQEQGNR